MKRAIQLNCDLGESFGSWQAGKDELIMPYVQQANIACGFHAGDPVVMRNTLLLAKKYGVTVGAHPSYPDLNGFGRRSMQMSEHELTNCLHYQIAALEGMAKTCGLALGHIKPHGALYNDMMTNGNVMKTVFAAVAAYHTKLSLMIQATPDWQAHMQKAQAKGIDLLFEGFIDRRYQADGRLQSRKIPGALLGKGSAIEQAKMLIDHHQVITDKGTVIRLHIDTLCIHGDGDNACELAETVSGYLQQA